MLAVVELVHPGIPQLVPAFRGPHTPEDPDALFAAKHESHSPSQSESQHTPSTHSPLLHSSPDEHGSPFGFGLTHCPPIH